MYHRKTADVFDIEGDYGSGWEIVTAEETRQQARERVKEYRENEPGISFRICKRREPITLDNLTPRMFNPSSETGKIRAGIQWVNHVDGPGCPHECYQFDTIAELQARAFAFMNNSAIVSFSIVTHTGQYRNMRTVYQWARI